MQYLRENNAKVGSPLEFAKGAQGAGQKLSDYYKNNYVKPLKEQPAGGSTVGSIYGQLDNINDQLRQAYRARTTGQQMSQLSPERINELEAERDKLNHVLYGTLSEHTGTPVEELQRINRTGAKLQSVGDVADAAQASRRAGYGGYTSSGIPIPLGSVERVTRLLSYLRGGPEASAGRQISRILPKVEGEVPPLRTPEDIASSRQSYQAQQEAAASANRATAGQRLQQGVEIEPEPNPLKATTEPPEPELSRRSARATERGESIAKSSAQSRADEFLRQQREQELLSKARQQQGSLRKKNQ
jgi:hypothetical protein